MDIETLIDFTQAFERVISPFQQNIDNGIISEELGHFFEAYNVIIGLYQPPTGEGPFAMVFFEGLDGTGKTSTCQTFKEMISERFPDKVVILVKTPPKSVAALRPEFEDQPEIVKRSYFWLSNYISMFEIMKQYDQNTIVIVDRHWPSTISYHLGHEKVRCGDSFSVSNTIYRWPENLPRPKTSLLVYLCTEEAERKRRIEQRAQMNSSIQITKEEETTWSEQTFRDGVKETYAEICKEWNSNTKDGENHFSIIINTTEMSNEQCSKEILEIFTTKIGL